MYIAGWDRSGSTLLDQVLDQLQGFFSVGELVDIWDRGPDSLCGCGRVLRNCDFWRQVFAQAFDVLPGDFDFPVAAALRRRCARSRHLPLTSSPILSRMLGSSLKRYLELTTKLYGAVNLVSGSQVIVDSSKHVTYGRLLELSGLAELAVLHLVRDPRGCAYSYQVAKAHPDPQIGRFPMMGTVRSSVHWIFANSTARFLWNKSQIRYLNVRYEDFIERPKEVVRRIMTLLGESAGDLSFLTERSARLKPGHGISGNSVRFRNGLVEFRRDDRWRLEMGRVRKATVTGLTGAFLYQYGYTSLNGLHRKS